MATRGHVRYSGNVRIEMEWCPGAAPSPSEKAGAYVVRLQVVRAIPSMATARALLIPRFRQSVGKPFYLYGEPKCARLEDVDRLAEMALEVALADEDVRGGIEPEFRSRDGAARAPVVYPFPREIATPDDANTRELVECATVLRRAGGLRSDRHEVVRGVSNDAAAHLRNKLQPAMLFLEEADAQPELDALRAILKFADALGGRTA